MADVFDVAKDILEKQGPMTAMKLQKLVYYSQAWSLVWDAAPIFKDEIEAWANGPVVPSLYAEHRGRFWINAADLKKGASKNLTEDEKETVDAVLETYGDQTPQFLSELTHREPPWADAREGLRVGERSRRPITNAAMVEYYESLL